jgi:hypothetical protein
MIRFLFNRVVVHIGSTKDKEKAIKDIETAQKSFGVAFPYTRAAPPSEAAILEHRKVVKGELGYAAKERKELPPGVCVSRGKFVSMLFIC